MTELEKMERARMYLDKLICGINPLDNTPIAADDIVHNVRIARCLQYVSEVLRQNIEREKKRLLPKTSKLPFEISDEQLAGYALSETPLRITEITNRINSLIDKEKMSSLSPTTITTWLITEELLYVHTHPDGKTSRYPTENGQRFGITTELRNGPNGDYTAVLYNSYAQRFILAHLREIIEKQQEKRLQRNSPQP